MFVLFSGKNTHLECKLNYSNERRQKKQYVKAI